MLGLISLPNPQPPFPISLNQSNPSSKSPFPKIQSLPFSQKMQKKFILHANQENGKNGLKPEPDNENGFKNGGLEDKEDVKKENELPKFNFRWVDLVLDPDPQNIVAVALTEVRSGFQYFFPPVTTHESTSPEGTGYTRYMQRKPEEQLSFKHHNSVILLNPLYAKFMVCVLSDGPKKKISSGSKIKIRGTK